MDEMKTSFDIILSYPFFVVALVNVALMAAVRKTVNALKPAWEESKLYKVILTWGVLVLGILLALIAKGIGQFETSWGYVVLLGILSAFTSSWIWNFIRRFTGNLIIDGSK